MPDDAVFDACTASPNTAGAPSGTYNNYTFDYRSHAPSTTSTGGRGQNPVQPRPYSASYSPVQPQSNSSPHAHTLSTTSQGGYNYPGVRNQYPNYGGAYPNAAQTPNYQHTGSSKPMNYAAVTNAYVGSQHSTPHPGTQAQWNGRASPVNIQHAASASSVPPASVTSLQSNPYSSNFDDFHSPVQHTPPHGPLGTVSAPAAPTASDSSKSTQAAQNRVMSPTLVTPATKSLNPHSPSGGDDVESARDKYLRAASPGLPPLVCSFVCLLFVSQHTHPLPFLSTLQVL